MIGKYLALAMVPLGLVQPLAAVTIDFDSLEEAGTQRRSLGATYTEDGFTITENSVVGGLLVAQQSHAQYAGSAGLHSIFINGPLELEIASKDGSAFDMTSIDLSLLDPAGTSGTVQFTGVLAGGGSVVQSFTTSTFGFQTFSFTGFDNIVRLKWMQGTSLLNAHQFDNIVLGLSAGGGGSSVPEANSTLLLLSMGMLGMMGWSRFTLNSRRLGRDSR